MKAWLSKQMEVIVKYVVTECSLEMILNRKEPLGRTFESSVEYLHSLKGRGPIIKRGVRFNFRILG